MIQEGNRQAALKQLHGVLDASIRGDEGHRLHAIGLQNFYLQLADPSLETVEAVVASLVEMPFDEIKRLQSADYNVGYDPDWFFANHGVEITDREKLMVGVNNTGSLIQSLARRFDSDTGEVFQDEDLDPKSLALDLYEQVQFSNSERKINLALQDVRNEPDLAERYQKGLALKEQVLAHLASFPFKFYKGESSKVAIEPTWETLLHASSLLAELKFSGGGSIVGRFNFEKGVDTAEAAISRYQFEKKLEALPKRDKEKFDELRLQFGAKAANLIILSEMVDEINSLRKNENFDITTVKVPEFQAVSVDIYKAWVAGELSDDQIRPYFDWANSLMTGNEWSSRKRPADFIVRSSAVFSEDGEQATGAGIYESIVVPAGSTFEEFKEAVIRVYASTQSEQAREYRQQYGIQSEEMGLVIQKFIPSESYRTYGGSNHGYVNSRLTGVPQLMEIVTETSRNFVKRDELDFALAMSVGIDSRAFHNVQQFPPDIYKIESDLPARLGQVTYVVERIWGRDIQIEFVYEDSSTINVVQVRDLPESVLGEAVQVEFPDEDPIHSGASIGVGDMELDVLDNESLNYEKRGLVVFEGNKKWTYQGRPHSFPKEGVVVIARNDGENGHIQTLAAERGLICIFPGDVERGSSLTFREFLNLRKVRVVSNGMEARMYAVSGEKDLTGQDLSRSRKYWIGENDQ